MDTGVIGGLVFRMYVDGKLVDEEHVNDLKQADVVPQRHAHLAEEAETRGQVWCAEVYDPDGPPDCNFHRFGTDASMMVAPIEVDDIEKDAEKHSPMLRRLTREAGL